MPYPRATNWLQQISKSLKLRKTPGITESAVLFIGYVYIMIVGLNGWYGINATQHRSITSAESQ